MTYLCCVPQEHFTGQLFLEVREEGRLPCARIEQDGRWMNEDAAFLQIVHLELLGGVLPLDGTCLHPVEFDRRLGQMHAGDTRPESTEDDSLDEVEV